jgi:hypothetical protein
MKPVLAFSLLGLAAAGGLTLATRYEKGHALRVEVQTKVSMDTTLNEVERDGTPVEGGVPGAKTELVREETHVDHVLAAEDGHPTKVRRTFTDLGGSSHMEAGEMERDAELESPFEGVTLELVKADDGSVEAKVVDGKEPDGDKALEGHRLELFLDGLLPAKAVEEGGTWEIDADAVKRALRADLAPVLFPPPARPDNAGGEGGGGRRRGGMGRMGGGGDSILRDADWKAEGKLVATDEKKDGVACAVVELTFETSGEREMEAPRGRRDGAYDPQGQGSGTTSYSVKLEGKLWFATQEKRPVALELEGTVRQETRREFTARESTMKMHSVREGKIEHKVSVSPEAVEPKGGSKGAKKD